MRSSYPPITTLDGSAIITGTGIEHATVTPEAKVARALASLSIFEDWSHQPLPTDVESRLIDLGEQELMTAAAVCLLRLSKLKAPAEREGDNAQAA